MSHQHPPPHPSPLPSSSTHHHPRPDPPFWTTWNMCTKLFWANQPSPNVADRPRLGEDASQICGTFTMRNRLRRKASLPAPTTASPPCVAACHQFRCRRVDLDVDGHHSNSSNTAFKPKASAAPRTIALYSASPLEVATVIVALFFLNPRYDGGVVAMLAQQAEPVLVEEGTPPPQKSSKGKYNDTESHNT